MAILSIFALIFSITAAVIATIASIKAVPLISNDARETSQIIRRLAQHYETENKLYTLLSQQGFSDNPQVVAWLENVRDSSRNTSKALEKSDLLNFFRHANPAANIRLLYCASAVSALLSALLQVVALV